jgi:outer membrane lipoprotein-sorting protein
MFSPKVDSIISKMKVAQDPQGKLATIQSKKVVALFRRNTKDKPALLTVLTKKPNMIRISLINPGAISIQKGFDGKTGWRLVTGKSLEILSGKALEALHFIAAFRAPGVNLSDLFETIELKGESIEAGRKCYELNCVPLSKFELPSITYYIDKETYLPIKRVESHRMSNGKLLVIYIYFNDYYSENGIMIPHNTVSEVNGELMEVNVKSVKWNVPCTQEDFAAPTEL